MIKRIIAVIAALSMIYGSGVYLSEGSTKNAVEGVLVSQRGIEAEPITPVPVKEENNDTITGSEHQDQPVEEGSGSTPEATAEDSGADGSVSEGFGQPSGVAEDVGDGEECDGEPDIGDVGDADGGTACATEPVEDATFPEEDAIICEDSGIAPEMEYIGDWTITAYCGCDQCCGSWGNATASGRPPVAGHTVACNILPFYTQIMIDGVVYEVEDTGYTEYGDYWIDIYFDTHEEALAYGVQTHEVYIVR